MDHLGMINTYSWDVVDLSSKKNIKLSQQMIPTNYPNNNMFFLEDVQNPNQKCQLQPPQHIPTLTSTHAASPVLGPRPCFLGSNRGPLKQLQNWLAASLGTCSLEIYLLCFQDGED
jgi:hypothetical protein